jgi:hypothetical protein
MGSKTEPEKRSEGVDPGNALVDLAVLHIFSRTSLELLTRIDLGYLCDSPSSFWPLVLSETGYL